MTRKPHPQVVAVLDALGHTRDLDNAERLLSVALGDADAIKWAMDRLAELIAGREALETLILAGVQAGGMRPVNELAADLGRDPAGLRKLLESRGAQTVQALSTRPKGPRVVTYVTRRGLEHLGIPHVPATQIGQ